MWAQREARGCLPPTGSQRKAEGLRGRSEATSDGHTIPRGRKRGGLRNRGEEVGTGRDSWRTDTMGLGGGPQGSNLFPQAGRLSSSRKVRLRKYGKKFAKNFSHTFERESLGKG